MISDNVTLENLLKVYYKEGVENLLFANSPLLMKIKKQRFEGKTYNFSAIAGGNFCCGADYEEAVKDATKVGDFKEFSVTAGNLFSVYGVNAKEMASVKTLKGAYMKPAGAKMFCATEGLRKAMATALYGRGFGEIGTYTSAGETITSGSTLTITFADMSSVMKLDLGSKVDIRGAVSTAVVGTFIVTSINGLVVTFKNLGSSSVVLSALTYVICLHGFSYNDGNDEISLAPIGLGGWLPSLKKRDGTESAWTTYIATSFYGVARNTCPDRLAGQFYTPSASEDYDVSLQKLLMQCRRAGSTADMIVLNDEDFYTISTKINTTNSYMAKVAEGAKRREASVGLAKLGVSFVEKWIENIIVDPYCPKGQFYILDSNAIEFISYTNTQKVNDSTADNMEKPDPMTEENNDVSNEPNQLLIDDMLSVKGGEDTKVGPSTRVSLMVYGNFVVYNPSVCGSGVFYNATPITTVA